MDESGWAIDTGKHVRVHWRHDGQVKCWTCVVGEQKGASFSVREVRGDSFPWGGDNEILSPKQDEWKFVRRTCIEDAVKDMCSACSDGSRGRCSREAMEHDPQDMPSFEQTHSNQKGVATENNRSVEGMSLDWVAPCESNESCHNQKASRPPSEWCPCCQKKSRKLRCLHTRERVNGCHWKLISKPKTSVVDCLEEHHPNEIKHRAEDERFVCTTCDSDMSSDPRGLLQRATFHLRSSGCKRVEGKKKESQRAMSFFRRAGFKLKVPGPSFVKPMIHIDPNLACKGFWFEEVVTGKHTCDPSMLLDSVPHPGDNCHPVEGQRFEVIGADGKKVSMAGTFMHENCNGFCLNAEEIGPSKHWMCGHCERTPRDDVFQKRLKRASQSHLKDRSKIDTKRLRRSQLVDRLRTSSSKLRKERGIHSWTRFTFAESRCKHKKQRDDAAEAKANLKKGNVHGLMENTKRLSLEGAFKKRKVLHNYLMDTIGLAVRQMDSDDSGDAKLMRGVRHHKSTKRLFMALQLQNGPKESSFSGPIFCVASEDETPVRPEPQRDPVTDTTDGLCGKATADHKCDPLHETAVGDPSNDDGDDAAWNRTLRGLSTSVFSTHVSIIETVPLTDLLPHVCIHIQPTCNRFDATPHVAEKWKQLLKVFEEVISSRLPIHLVGNGSDGDARRALMQLLDTHKAHSSELAHTLNAVGFNMAGLKVLNEDGSLKTVRNLHMQGPKHKAKKLDSCMNIAGRSLVLGNCTADGRALQAVVDVKNGDDVVDHGLRMEDVNRDDRQNFEACVRRSSLKVSELMRTRLRGSHRTPGTETMIELNREFMTTFFGKKTTLATRIERAGHIVTFLRLWSLEVKGNQQLRLNANFMPHQSFNHIVLSCMSAVPRVKLFRDSSPHRPCRLDLPGSDVCERTFSDAGGFGQTASHMRNHNTKEFRDFITRNDALTRLHVGEHKMHDHVRHKKTECDHRCHEDTEEDDADLTDHPTDEEMKKRWEAGSERARRKCCELGMNDMPNDLLQDPSAADDLQGFDTKGMAQCERHMREANEDAAAAAQNNNDGFDNLADDLFRAMDLLAPPGGDDDDEDDDEGDDRGGGGGENGRIRRGRRHGHALDVRTPSGKFITKQKAVHLVLQSLERNSPGHLGPKLSKDGQRKVSQSADMAAKRSLLASCGADGLHHSEHDLRPGADVALRSTNLGSDTGILHFAEITRMTKLPSNGRRVLAMRPVKLSDPPKSLHCSFQFRVEAEDSPTNDGSRKHHCGPDGNVGMDTTQHDAVKNIVDDLQPRRMDQEAKEANAVRTIANQMGDSQSRPRRASTVTRVGRSTGISGMLRRMNVLEAWKKAFATKMEHLNWEVCSIEHLDDDACDSAQDKGRRDHVEAMDTFSQRTPTPPDTTSSDDTKGTKSSGGGGAGERKVGSSSNSTNSINNSVASRNLELLLATFGPLTKLDNPCLLEYMNAHPIEALLTQVERCCGCTAKVPLAYLLRNDNWYRCEGIDERGCGILYSYSFCSKMPFSDDIGLLCSTLLHRFLARIPMFLSAEVGC
eukprot:jgi/Bigna1/80217/fgenesh1_pg.69_\